MKKKRKKYRANCSILAIIPQLKQWVFSFVKRISKNFGTYYGENAIYVFEDKYLVISGCYETSSLGVWVEQAKDRGLTQEVINKEVFKINCILKDVGLT